MEISLSNPIILIAGGLLFLFLIYLWNRRNANVQRKRRTRSFRRNYQQKKKQKEE